MFDAQTLAIIFIGLMALATLLYAILDGYDLGVGMLMPLNDQDKMQILWSLLLDHFGTQMKLG